MSTVAREYIRADSGSDSESASGSGPALFTPSRIAFATTEQDASGPSIAGRPAVSRDRRRRTEWLSRLRQLDDLSRLGPNWNSYGAEPIDKDSITVAAAILRCLATESSIELPTVTASPDGNAALAWDDGRYCLDLEVLPDGRMEYAFVDRADAEQDQEGRTREIQRIVSLLSRG